MDLIRDLDGTSPPVRNRTFSLFDWLEMPFDSFESRMLDNLGSSERHVLPSTHTTVEPGVDSLANSSYPS